MKPTTAFALLIISFICPLQNPATADPGLDFPNGTELLSTKAEDSLTTKRKILTTSLYQNGLKLAPKTVRDLFQEDKNARRKYLAGKIIMPLGPVISLSGIALGYVAIKGKKATAQVKYTHPEVTATYTVRSRGKLAAGLGLFIGGIIMLESGNELVIRSGRRYNAQHGGQSSPLPVSFHFGVTPSGNFGLYASF